jgi:hypothetical protein
VGVLVFVCPLLSQVDPSSANTEGSAATASAAPYPRTTSSGWGAQLAPSAGTPAETVAFMTSVTGDCITAVLGGDASEPAYLHSVYELRRCGCQQPSSLVPSLVCVRVCELFACAVLGNGCRSVRAGQVEGLVFVSLTRPDIDALAWTNGL